MFYLYGGPGSAGAKCVYLCILHATSLGAEQAGRFTWPPFPRLLLPGSICLSRGKILHTRNRHLRNPQSSFAWERPPATSLTGWSAVGGALNGAQFQRAQRDSLSELFL